MEHVNETEPSGEQQDDAAVRERPRRRRKGKRQGPLSPESGRQGRKTKLAPTAKVFSCSRCPYSVTNRFDSLR